MQSIDTTSISRPAPVAQVRAIQATHLEAGCVYTSCRECGELTTSPVCCDECWAEASGEVAA